MGWRRFAYKLSYHFFKIYDHKNRKYSLAGSVVDVDEGVVLLRTVAVSFMSLTSSMVIINLESTFQLQRFKSKAQSSALTDASGGSTAMNYSLATLDYL